MRVRSQEWDAERMWRHCDGAKSHLFRSAALHQVKYTAVDVLGCPAVSSLTQQEWKPSEWNMTQVMGWEWKRKWLEISRASEQDPSRWESGARQVSLTIRTAVPPGAAWDGREMWRVCARPGVKGRVAPLINLLYSLFDWSAIKHEPPQHERCQTANLSEVSPARGHRSFCRFLCETAVSITFRESLSKHSGSQHHDHVNSI